MSCAVKIEVICAIFFLTSPTRTQISGQQVIFSRPTLEEEKRRELVIGCLKECSVDSYDADVVDTLVRWLAQESKAAVQDKRGELSGKGISPDGVSKLVIDCMGMNSSHLRKR